MAQVEHGSSRAAGLPRIAHATRDLAAAISSSRLNYWASYVADFSCPVLFVYLGQHRGAPWPAIVFAFAFGLAAFSLIEYAIHRWLLHDPRSALYHLHDAHHTHPEVPSAFLFPTSLIVLSLVWLILARVLHIPAVSFFIAGVAAGYCYFGLLHHVEHSTRINQIPFRWLQRRWAAHSVHHRLDRHNFGVITSFWDHVFATHHKQAKPKPLHS